MSEVSQNLELDLCCSLNPTTTTPSPPFTMHAAAVLRARQPLIAFLGKHTPSECLYCEVEPMGRVRASCGAAALWLPMGCSMLDARCSMLDARRSPIVARGLLPASCARHDARTPPSPKHTPRIPMTAPTNTPSPPRPRRTPPRAGGHCRELLGFPRQVQG
jgi:hypothetical protein